MKKVTYLSLAIILLFVICICVTVKQKREHSEGIALESLIACHTNRAGSVHFNSDGKLNINTATVAELTLLTGIGQTLAHRIVRYREDNGPYNTVCDLLNVDGIGERKLSSFVDHVCAE